MEAKKASPWVKDFLTRMSELGIDPNFYCSMPYLNQDDLRVVTKEGWMYIEGEEGIAISPAIPVGRKQGQFPLITYWSDCGKSAFDLLFVRSLFNAVFLDNEYLFDPKAFNDLRGGKWEVFRKNINHHLSKKDSFVYTDKLSLESELANLVGDFLLGKKDRLEDGEFLFDFIFTPQDGIFKKYLYFEDRLVGINAWDENYKYINFRVCFVDPSIPFLSEFARYLFYTDSLIQEKGKLVNDGGDLGNEGLKRFKEKMNPVRTRKVFSWIPVKPNL